MDDATSTNGNTYTLKIGGVMREREENRNEQSSCLCLL